MEILITYQDSELHNALYSCYYNICETIKTAALLHFKTIKTNNAFHFEKMVIDANKAISDLLILIPQTDSRRGEFQLINHKEMIKYAEDFFSQDFF